jgi:hypothetical protein
MYVYDLISYRLNIPNFGMFILSLLNSKQHKNFVLPSRCLLTCKKCCRNDTFMIFQGLIFSPDRKLSDAGVVPVSGTPVPSLVID